MSIESHPWRPPLPALPGWVTAMGAVLVMVVIVAAGIIRVDIVVV